MNRGRNRGGYHRGTRNSPLNFRYNHDGHDNHHDSTHNSSTYQHNGSSHINGGSLQEQTSLDDAARNNLQHIQQSAVTERSSSRQYRQKTPTDWKGDPATSFANQQRHQHRAGSSAGIGRSSNIRRDQHGQKATERTSDSSPSSGYQQPRQPSHHHDSTRNSPTYQHDGSSHINGVFLQEQTSLDDAAINNLKHIQESALTARSSSLQYRQKPPTDWKEDPSPSFANQRRHQHHAGSSASIGRSSNIRRDHQHGQKATERTSDSSPSSGYQQPRQPSHHHAGSSAGIGRSSNIRRDQCGQEATERTSDSSPSSGYQQPRQPSHHHAGLSAGIGRSSNIRRDQCGQEATERASDSSPSSWYQQPRQPSHHHETTSTENVLVTGMEWSSQINRTPLQEQITPESVSSNSLKHLTGNEGSSNVVRYQHIQKWPASPESSEHLIVGYGNQMKETLQLSSTYNKYPSCKTNILPQQRTWSNVLVKQESSEPKTPPLVSSDPPHHGSLQRVSSGGNDSISKTVGPDCGQISQERGSSECCSPERLEAFDICLIKSENHVKLKVPLLIKNRERRKERSRAQSGSEERLLRPGMVLLKNYVSQPDQLKIIKVCRELGLGAGGFYQPCFSDGGKMNLNMMCLGRNWDPETKLYGDRRSIDGAVPPCIPEELKMLVKSAIQSSHALIKRELKGRNPEEIVPSMEPDICIVNFYTKSGKLGLHQDKDESKESLHRGLPVVSFSIGDSADFLYGDDRDDEKAEKVVLESGDVLIFGGKSRHIYHGVPSIFPDSAPKLLVEDSKLRPGRLNLTFRQY